MPHVEVNDIRMYYEEQGQGSPLLLLHGGTGAIEFQRAGWGALTPSFAEHFRAFQIEHRGHARTNNPSGYLSYAQMANDVATFIEQVSLAPAHVAGVSDGGIVALTLGGEEGQLVFTDYAAHFGRAHKRAALEIETLGLGVGFPRGLLAKQDTQRPSGRAQQYGG